MRRLVLLSVALALCTAGCRKRLALHRTEPDAAPAIADDGVRWSHVEEDALAVDLPGVPKTEVTNQATPVGTATIRQHQVDIGDTSFAFMRLDVPSAPTWNSKGSVDGAITQGLDALRKTPGIRAVRPTSEQPAVVAGMAGRDVHAVAERTEGTPLHARVLCVSGIRQTYMLLAIVHSDRDPIVDKFVGSLRATTNGDR